MIAVRVPAHRSLRGYRNVTYVPQFHLVREVLPGHVCPTPEWEGPAPSHGGPTRDLGAGHLIPGLSPPGGLRDPL